MGSVVDETGEDDDIDAVAVDAVLVEVNGNGILVTADITPSVLL